MSLINPLTESLDFSFHLFYSEIPNHRSKLIENLRNYGIFLNPLDKIYFEDMEDNIIEIKEENLNLYSKNITESIIKIILKKYKTIDDQENPLNISDDFPTKYNIKDEYNKNENILKNQSNNLNHSLDSISFSESFIFNNHDTCFVLMSKRYLSEINHLLNHNYFEDEKNFSNFKNYLINYSNTLNLNTEDIHFSEEEIKSACDNLTHIHNVICIFIEKNYEKKKFFNINYTEINEKLRSEIINSQEIKKNFRKFQEKFDKNKCIFNRFMIELNEHIGDFDFYMQNDNFEPNKFENNLTQLFSFLVSLIFDFNEKLLEKYPFKTKKYEKIIKDFMNKKFHLTEDNNNFQYYRMELNENLNRRKRERLELDYIIENNNIFDI